MALWPLLVESVLLSRAEKIMNNERGHAGSPPPPGARLCVSVVMPVYNEGRFIQAALQSLQAQSTPNFDLEILVIDGMSDDDTQQKVTALCAKDFRVRLLSNPSVIHRLRSTLVCAPLAGTMDASWVRTPPMIRIT